MSSAPHPQLLDDLVPDGPHDATLLSVRPTHELVVDLSQLEFALRARQGRNACGSVAQADAGFHTLLLRKNAILDVLRSRGLDFPSDSSPSRPPEGSVAEGSVREGAGAGSQSRRSRRIAELEAQVERLEQARAVNALHDRAVGIPMERRHITAAEDAQMLQLTAGTSPEEPGAVADALPTAGAVPPVRSSAAKNGVPPSSGRLLK